MTSTIERRPWSNPNRKPPIHATRAHPMTSGLANISLMPEVSATVHRSSIVEQTIASERPLQSQGVVHQVYSLRVQSYTCLLPSCDIFTFRRSALVEAFPLIQHIEYCRLTKNMSMMCYVFIVVLQKGTNGRLGSSAALDSYMYLSFMLNRPSSSTPCQQAPDDPAGRLGMTASRNFPRSEARGASFLALLSWTPCSSF